MTKQQRIARFYERMSELGFTCGEIEILRRAQLTLHRWHEQECGDGNDHASWAIERDEQTGIPYRCVYPHNGQLRRYRVPDLEKGAKKRIASVLSNHPDLWAYIQSDPRGCALYVGRKPADFFPGWSHQNYNQGVACVAE